MKRRAAAIFISDLHLSAEQPGTTRAFLDFLARSVIDQTERLYILGDLFEYWAGDDDLDDAFNHVIVTALRQVADSGIALFFMAGNRDFLIGSRWAAATGATLLSDPCVVRFNGQSAVLSHGDALCTDDRDYQSFRSMVRAPDWQSDFLARPLAERQAVASTMRMQSEQAKLGKQAEIMDVNAAAVADLFRQSGEQCLIHGHTHRPAHHHLNVDGRPCERWVLPDWHVDAQLPRRGGALIWNDHGLSMLPL